MLVLVLGAAAYTLVECTNVSELWRTADNMKAAEVAFNKLTPENQLVVCLYVSRLTSDEYAARVLSVTDEDQLLPEEVVAIAKAQYDYALAGGCKEFEDSGQVDLTVSRLMRERE